VVVESTVEVAGETAASGLPASPPPLAAIATPTLKATTSAGTSMIFMNVDIRILLAR
jgi:hypothetical protein